MDTCHWSEAVLALGEWGFAWGSGEMKWHGPCGEAKSWIRRNQHLTFDEAWDSRLRSSAGREWLRWVADVCGVEIPKRQCSCGAWGCYTLGEVDDTMREPIRAALNVLAVGVRLRK